MLRIGAGAGFAGDRIAPAVELAERGALDWLVLECLAERTIALGQQRRLRDPALGYEERLDAWIEALGPALAERPVRLMTNFGAANPEAAGVRIRELCDLDVAVLTGDDVLDRIDPRAPADEDGLALEEHGALVSANAYLGVAALLGAVATGAQVVVTGRVADPSLFLAPLVARFGWGLADWDLLARGTVVGHLLECGTQLTGGYFADPPRKDVPNLAHLGCPLAEVERDGTATFSKLPGTGGRLDRLTVSEQLTYEVTDPCAYLTPDVTADFTTVRLASAGADRMTIAGATGSERPAELKVSVGYRAGFRCVAEISYAGRNALARAELAGAIVEERLPGLELRRDVIGLNALHGDLAAGAPPYECRLRVAALASTRERAEAVGHEVVGLYTNGPAGGGGATSRTDEVIGIVSTRIARDRVAPKVVVA
jgi:hypothetical protein